MKKVFIFVFIFIVIALAVWFAVINNKEKVQDQTSQAANITKQNNMEITSPQFGDNQNIPKDYTCDGQDINPPLEFNNLPQNTQSLALIMDDPDATTTWVHWLLWNIDPSVNSISENSVPSGAVQGKTSSGQNAYGGPCPPSGIHHYHFTLYALDAKLDLPTYSQKADLEKAMADYIIAQAELVGLYSR